MMSIRTVPELRGAVLFLYTESMEDGASISASNLVESLILTIKADDAADLDVITYVDF